MLYIQIIITILAFFIFLISVYYYVTNKKKSKNTISISEPTESLNVEKIISVANDKDFIRNEFWFQFKEKQTINVVNFYKLKKLFEQEQGKVLKDLIVNEDEILNLDIENIVLIQYIISDEYESEKIAKAFYLLEKRLK